MQSVLVLYLALCIDYEYCEWDDETKWAIMAWYISFPGPSIGSPLGPPHHCIVPPADEFFQVDGVGVECIHRFMRRELVYSRKSVKKGQDTSGVESAQVDVTQVDSLLLRPAG